MKRALLAVVLAVAATLAMCGLTQGDRVLMTLSAFLWGMLVMGVAAIVSMLATVDK